VFRFLKNSLWLWVSCGELQAMTKAITNRQLYPAIAGGLLVALACGAALKIIHASQANTAKEAESVAVVETDVAEDPFQESTPFFQPSASPRLADPGLLRSTQPQARAESVATGRPDPFASIVTAPRRPLAQPTVANVSPVVPSSPIPAGASSRIATAPAAPSAKAPASSQTSMPVVSVATTQSLPSLPPLPPVPMVPGSNLDPGTVEVGPTITSAWAGSPVDQVVVSGVAKIGNRVSVIVHEMGSNTSKRVAPGDYVANGQVQIKSVDLSNAEPVVVLSYNGQDYQRSVGSETLIGSL
jgi:hypothetical protein